MVIVSGDNDDNVDVIQVFGEGTPDFLLQEWVGRESLLVVGSFLVCLSMVMHFRYLPRPLCDYWVSYQVSQLWCLFIPVGSVLWEGEDLGRSLGVFWGLSLLQWGDVSGCRGKSWAESHGPRTKAEIH